MSGITSVTLVVSNHSPSICLYRRTRRLHAMRWQPMHGASVVTRCARIKDRGKLSDFLIPLNNSDLALSILSPLSEFCAHTSSTLEHGGLATFSRLNLIIHHFWKVPHANQSYLHSSFFSQVCISSCTVLIDPTR